MDSSYTLSIKSFKIFSSINNIKGPYNIKNNVMNSKKYEITLYYDKIRLATDLTSELSGSLKRKSSLVQEVLSFQATNKFMSEDGFCDWPMIKIEKDFKQLLKPINVIMTEKPDRLNVCYEPITFSGSSGIFKGHMILHQDIMTLLLKILNLKKYRNYQVEVEAEVYAVVSTDLSPSERVDRILSPNNSDLLDSTGSSEIVTFCAFAQTVGDNDQLDSNIVMSVSEVKQYGAPHNVTYVFNSDQILGDEFVVKFEEPEVQVINNDTYQIIKTKETKEKEVIVKVNNLKSGIYKVRVRQIPQEPDDLTKAISSNWKVSEKPTTIQINIMEL
ncbi:26830_t:CDS:2 [Gigaspora margarita]|uniref:26830_t:CDS:1 n=1 Tax=Gigaspora margarita TaxID=4874 RepID=A0ABN7UR10_GIGMA|nr:26830_t:CDS:2 [Gigaspora margarita]